MAEEATTTEDPETESGPTSEESESQSEKDWQAEADKWKALARKNESQAKSNAEAAKKLAEMQDAEKSESEKLTERLTAAEQKAQQAERVSLQLEVALDKAPEGLSVAKVRKLAKRLTGDNREELEADAEDLFADFAPASSDDDDDTETAPRARPKEKLRPGATGDDDETPDYEKIAQKILDKNQF